MGRVGQQLGSPGLVALDSSILIYHLEAAPRYAELTFELLSGIESGQWSAVISTISLMEIAVRPWQLSAGAIAAEYEALLVNLPNLAIVDVTRDVAREAARLRASKGFSPADALVAATALVSESTALVTNDKTFARLRDRIDVMLLDELLVG